MKNWSHTIEKFDNNSTEREIWRLEQLINFGLDGEKISLVLLKKHMSSLKIDSNKKKYLLFLLKSK